MVAPDRMISQAHLTFLLTCLLWTTSLFAMNQKTSLLLEKLEQGDSFKVRIAAAQALGNLRDHEAVPRMCEAFNKEEDFLVKIAIISGLAMIKNLEATLFIALKGTQVYKIELMKTIERELTKLQDFFDARDWSRALLEEHNASLRSNIAWVLGLIGNEQITSVLLQAANDSNQNVRAKVVEALGRLRVTDAVDVLERMRPTTTDPQLRQAISTAISLINASPPSRIEKISLSDDKRGSITYDVFKSRREVTYSDRIHAALNALSGVEKRGENVAVKTERSHTIDKVAALTITIVDEDDTSTIREVSSSEFRNFLRETINAMTDQCRMDNPNKMSIYGSVTYSFALARSGRANDISLGGSAVSKDRDFGQCLRGQLTQTIFYKLPKDDEGTINYSINIAKPRERKLAFD